MRAGASWSRRSMTGTSATARDYEVDTVYIWVDSVYMATTSRDVLVATARAHLVPEADALEGLSDFCVQQDAQLLVLATTDGCMTRRFFHPHYTQTRAYHLRIPVLLLPTGIRPTEASCAECRLRGAATLQGKDASPALLLKN